MLLNRMPFSSTLRTLALVVGCATVAATMACTGDAGTGPEGEPSANPEGEPEGDISPTVLADAYETLLDDCDSFSSEIGLFDDIDFRELLLAVLADAEANPNVVIDQEALNACHAYILTDEACDDLNTGGFGGNAGCDDIFVGQLAEGATCDDTECEPGLYCASGQGPECGTCAPVPTEGEACPNFTCDTGLTCEFNDAFEPVCVVEPGPFAVGDACENDCGGLTTGLACINEICEEIAVSAVGEECDDDAIICAPYNTTYCEIEGDREVGVCTATPTVGESCAESFSCLDSFCDFGTTTCTAYLAAGESCQGGECGEGLSCNSENVCAEETGDDEQCTE